MRGFTLRNGKWERLTGSRGTRRSGTKSGHECPKCKRKVRPWKAAAHMARHERSNA